MKRLFDTTGKEIERISHKYRTDEKSNVAYYSRVSTEHEAQVHAHENQDVYLEKEIEKHPNWRLTERFSEPSASGTEVEHRSVFLGMIQMVKTAYENHETLPFTLIVVRELTRFTRNLLDCIKYIGELRVYGVEVYFCKEGLYSFQPETEILLPILANQAQSESEHISDRVRAGQEVSRMKNAKGEAPVLYGSGLLGYELIKRPLERSNTYQIIEEEAETVRMIYQWYVEEGYGMKQIASMLTERKRKRKSGEVKWDTTTISRILSNKTYANFKCYNKWVTTDPQKHTRRKNTDESTYKYYPGDWEPIIPLDFWEEAQRIRHRRRRKIKDEYKKNGSGKKEASDRWTSKMVCECGSTFKCSLWHVDKMGRKCYGYLCRNVKEYRRKSFHNGNGLPGEGRCDTKGIVQWRMDYQWKLILDRIWDCPEQTLNELYGEIQDNYELPAGAGDAEGKIEQLQKRKERQERRLDILLEKLMEEVIPDAAYQAKKKEVEEQIRIISDDIQALTGDSCPIQMMPEEKVKRNLEEIKSVLDSYTRSVTEGIPSTDLIDKFVVRVTALEDGSFRWYLNFGKEIPYDEAFDEKYYQLIDKFEAGFEEAKEYRRSTGHFIRRNQWRDLDVEVYLYTGSSSLDMER